MSFYQTHEKLINWYICSNITERFLGHVLQLIGIETTMNEGPFGTEAGP